MFSGSSADTTHPRTFSTFHLISFGTHSGFRPAYFCQDKIITLRPHETGLYSDVWECGKTKENKHKFTRREIKRERGRERERERERERVREREREERDRETGKGVY